MNLIGSDMYHLYTIWVKPKYNIKFVLAINESYKKYGPSPFVHYCLTDQPDQFKNTDIIPIDIREYDLEGWWFKLLLFKPGLCQPGTKCMFFDLDSKLLKPIDNMIRFDDKLILAHNPSKVTHKTIVNRSIRNQSLGMYFTILNSSTMMWIGGNHHDLYEKFAKNSEDYMIKYFGNDEFITYEYDGGYDLIDMKWIQNSRSMIDCVFALKMSTKEMIDLMI